MDPPSEDLQTVGVRTLDDELPIGETASSIDDVNKTVVRLRGGKAVGICKVNVELLKAGIEAMIRELHGVLTPVWHSGTILPD